MVEQLCEYAEIHWSVHFKWVNYMLYALWLIEG